MTDREALALLQEACVSIQREDRRAYRRCMEAARIAIGGLPDNRALRGEWLLASALAGPTDLGRLCALLREARQLIDGRSRLLPPGAPPFDYYCAFALCNEHPGQADENAGKLAEAVRLHYSLTGGGLGTDVCYRAQLAHYRGRTDEARALAMEAFELVGHRGLVALWAAYMLADLAKHEGDGTLWRFAYQHIASVANGTREADRACREQAQMLLCMLDMSLGFLQSVPQWVRDGDFGIISAEGEGRYEIVGDKILRGTVIPALVTQMEYAAYSGQPAKALNVADAMQKVYGLGNVELDAYLGFFRASCYFSLDDVDRAKAAVRQAVEAIAPDGLWLIAAEFVPSRHGALILEAAEQVDGEGARRIREIGAGFWDKLEPLRDELLENAPVGLTKREHEVAMLLVEGKSNGEIAAALGISERTVKGHLTNIYSKYHVSRRTQVAKAMERAERIELAPWAS